MKEFWAQQLTIAAISRGELHTVEECERYYREFLKDRDFFSDIKPDIPSEFSIPSLEDRFDIDVDALKDQIIEAVYSLTDQLGKNPNAMQIANETQIKKDLTQEILNSLVKEGLLKTVKVGRGITYAPDVIYPEPAATMTLPEEFTNIPIDEVEVMLEQFSSEISQQNPQKKITPVTPPSSEIASFLSRGPRNPTWGDQEDAIIRLMDQLKISAGERMELSYVYRGKPDELVDELSRRYMEKKK